MRGGSTGWAELLWAFDRGTPDRLAMLMGRDVSLQLPTCNAHEQGVLDNKSNM